VAVLLRVVPMRGVRTYGLRGDSLTGAGASDTVVLLQGLRQCGVCVLLGGGVVG